MAYCHDILRIPYVETENGSLVGPGTRYPFGYTEEEYIYIYTRIKTLSIDVTWAGERKFYSGPTLTATQTWAVNKTATYSISSRPSEEYLPSRCYLRSLIDDSFFSDAAKTVYENGDPDTFRDVFIANPQGVKYVYIGYPFQTDIVCYKYGEKFYPYLRHDFWFGLGDPNIDFYIDLFITTPVGTLPTENPNLRFFRPFFNDESVSCYSGSLYQTSGEFKITAGEYWPYDPGDTASYPGKDGSGPVYDSSTGAQLRNPFNIVKRGDGTFYNPNA